MKKNEKQSRYNLNTKILIAIIILLIILLSVSISYVINMKYEEIKKNNYNQGVQDATVIVLANLYQQLLTCKPLPLTAGNQTINIIAIECLQ